MRIDLCESLMGIDSMCDLILRRVESTRDSRVPSTMYVALEACLYLCPSPKVVDNLPTSAKIDPIRRSTIFKQHIASGVTRKNVVGGEFPYIMQIVI